MFKAVLRNDDRNIWAANGIGKMHCLVLVISKPISLRSYDRRFSVACVHISVAGKCM